MFSDLQEIKWVLEAYVDHWNTYNNCGFLGNDVFKDTKRAIRIVNKLVKQRKCEGRNATPYFTNDDIIKITENVINTNKGDERV